MAHRDGYTAFVSSGLGKRLATTLGLPQPVALRRHVPGRPLVDGPVLVGGHTEQPALSALRQGLTDAGATLVDDVPESARLGGVVVDLSAARTPADLEALRATLSPRPAAPGPVRPRRRRGARPVAHHVGGRSAPPSAPSRA